MKRIFVQIWRFTSTADKVIIFSTFLLGISSLFFLHLGSDSRVEVWISVSNEIKYRLHVSQNRDLYVQGRIGVVHIRINDKKVWVTNSSCPHKICMRMGKISRAGQMIVCVPNQVVIVLRSRHNDVNLDVITQ